MEGTDTDQMNVQRVYWAQTVLDAFQEQTRCGSEEEAFRDLLADLRHWADNANVSWEESLDLAMRNYLQEAENGYASE